MFIDDVEFSNQRKGKFHHCADVHVLSVVLRQRREQRSSASSLPALIILPDRALTL